MTTLTQCQQQVLDMLISYQKERGFPPTNQEVATMLGYRSVNAAVEHSAAKQRVLEGDDAITAAESDALVATLCGALTRSLFVTVISGVLAFLGFQWWLG